MKFTALALSLGLIGAHLSLHADEQKVELEVIRPAPDFVGITEWQNSKPLSLKDLKGKVVLVDFWDYSCINCLRTFPYLLDWYNKYKDKGFVIVGVHAPEFEFEKDPKNVKAAVERFKLPYPIALDNDYATWRAYNNAYWPCHYLIDQNGNIRYIHIGEGNYLETENAIRSLLNLPPLSEIAVSSKKDLALTNEIYLGYKRADNYNSQNKLHRDQQALYYYKSPIDADQVAISGDWLVSPEKITAMSDDCQLELNFIAAKVHMVLSGDTKEPLTVTFDGKPLPKGYFTSDMGPSGQITIKEARKYDIIDLGKDYGRHTIVLHIPKGVSAYSFTFGN